MTDRRVLPAVLIVAACALGFLWLTEIPLGIVGPPFEWAWERISILEDAVPDVLLGIVVALAAGVCYLATAGIGARRIGTAKLTERSIWLSALIIAGYFWLLAVQESPPSPYGMSKTPWAIYYRGPSGYYFEARYKITSTVTFLENYEQRISNPADSDRVLHIGTHPPGLFVFERTMLWLCGKSPWLTDFLIECQPPSVKDAFDSVEANSSGTPHALLRLDRAAVWLSALVIQLFCVLTIIPLYAFIRRDATRLSAWRAVAFWPLVPAIAVFLPASDALLPFFGMTFLALWMYGRQKHSSGLCILSGIALFAGMFISLAVLPYALLAAVLTVWEVFKCDSPPARSQVKSSLLSVAWALVGFFVPVAIVAAAFRLNLPQVWLINLRNHADFYTQYPRTYWKWLIANPLELAFAVGFPLALLAIVAAVRAARTRDVGSRRSVGTIVGCVAVWAFLWLSGKNMGEAARLWIAFQPWVILLAASALSTNGIPAENRNRPLSMASWLIVLGVQMVVCLGTVVRVTGFNFSGG